MKIGMRLGAMHGTKWKCDPAYKLTYVRGPSDILVMFAEDLRKN